MTKKEYIKKITTLEALIEYNEGLNDYPDDIKNGYINYLKNELLWYKDIEKDDAMEDSWNKWNNFREENKNGK